MRLRLLLLLLGKRRVVVSLLRGLLGECGLIRCIVWLHWRWSLLRYLCVEAWWRLREVEVHGLPVCLRRGSLL